MACNKILCFWCILEVFIKGLLCPLPRSPIAPKGLCLHCLSSASAVKLTDNMWCAVFIVFQVQHAALYISRKVTVFPHTCWGLKPETQLQETCSSLLTPGIQETAARPRAAHSFLGGLCHYSWQLELLQHTTAPRQSHSCSPYMQQEPWMTPTTTM